MKIIKIEDCNYIKKQPQFRLLSMEFLGLHVTETGSGNKSLDTR